MRTDIRFAGLSLEWRDIYADAYSRKLWEMGHYAKRLPFGNSYVVAYSYKPFSLSEASEVLHLIYEEGGLKNASE